MNSGSIIILAPIPKMPAILMKNVPSGIARGIAEERS
jgi:hypothetical protein